MRPESTPKLTIATLSITHLEGILAKLNYGVPLVITIHSLEPLRPWEPKSLVSISCTKASLRFRRTMIVMLDLNG